MIARDGRRADSGDARAPIDRGSPTPIQLRSKNLVGIGALGVPVPGYDRATIRPRILHLGVGGFHRAHMALYTDELAGVGGTWGIRGLGTLEADRKMAGVLQAQDRLYTLVERDSEGSYPRVLGSIVDYVLDAGDHKAVIECLTDPEIAILSLTITEGGYSIARGNPTIEAIVAGLDSRRRSAGSPLTILSCDNLPQNGEVAREAISTVAGQGTELTRFVEACTFPNSMVDRITPQTTEADRAWLRDEVGIDDRWPVVCERFRQWVIEDRFVAGRPAWEDVGVLFTDRVHDWELYKLRMLNASHSCMAYLMALAGVVYVDEAIALPAVRCYLDKFLTVEAIPVLQPIPDYPAVEYANTVLDRFANTGVRDQIARLCIDGTAKFPSFLIPTIEAQLEQDGPVACAALALAGWARYLATVPQADRARDSRGGRAAALAKSSVSSPLAFLQLEEVFSPPLRESQRFREAFRASAVDLAQLGPIGAIEKAAPNET